MANPAGRRADPCAVPWAEVHTVFLDMDGTLLDLYFDNHFWREHVPMRFAQKHGLSVHRARHELMARYREAEGTLEWYCVNYWTEQLGMDIADLKREVEHLIALRPEVLDFLQSVRDSGRRIVLVTNAHGKSIDIKMQRTQLGERMDRVVCAHDLGLAKENAGFWDRLAGIEPFDPERTLLVDDSLAVLRSAQRHGIRHLRGVRRPDSRQPARDIDEFPAIDSFAQIMPVPSRRSSRTS